MRAAVLLFATTSVLAQTAAPKTTTPKPPVHRRAATPAAAPKPAASTAAPEANGPGIPVVDGEPKTLYALRYIDTLIGTGELAAPRKWYTVHYTGWLPNGTKFDSSVDRGETFTFPYGARRVIIGWDTGFEGMHVGGKRRLIVPYQLAYGEQANEKIPAKSTLIFDVELIAMGDAPPPPPTAPKPAEEPAKPAAAPATGAPATPAPANAPGNPGHPDPAKLPGAPPTGE